MLQALLAVGAIAGGAIMAWMGYNDGKKAGADLFSGINTKWIVVAIVGIVMLAVIVWFVVRG